MPSTEVLMSNAKNHDAALPSPRIFNTVAMVKTTVHVQAFVHRTATLPLTHSHLLCAFCICVCNICMSHSHLCAFAFVCVTFVCRIHITFACSLCFARWFCFVAGLCAFVVRHCGGELLVVDNMTAPEAVQAVWENTTTKTLWLDDEHYPCQACCNDHPYPPAQPANSLYFT